MTPTACLNDGLLDVTMQHGPASLLEYIKVLGNMILFRGGHVFADNYASFRGASVKISNRNVAFKYEPAESNSDYFGFEEAQAARGEAVEEKELLTRGQKFQVDGEALRFDKFVKFEAVPGAIDIIVDYGDLMRKQGIATR